VNLIRHFSFILLALAISLQNIYAGQLTDALAGQSIVPFFSHIDPEEIQDLVNQGGEVARLALKFAKRNGVTWPENQAPEDLPDRDLNLDSDVLIQPYVAFNLEPYEDHDPFSGTKTDKTRFIRSNTWNEGEEIFLRQFSKKVPQQYREKKDLLEKSMDRMRTKINRTKNRLERIYHIQLPEKVILEFVEESPHFEVSEKRLRSQKIDVGMDLIASFLSRGDLPNYLDLVLEYKILKAQQVITPALENDVFIWFHLLRRFQGFRNVEQKAVLERMVKAGYPEIFTWLRDHLDTNFYLLESLDQAMESSFALVQFRGPPPRVRDMSEKIQSLIFPELMLPTYSLSTYQKLHTKNKISPQKQYRILNPKMIINRVLFWKKTRLVNFPSSKVVELIVENDMPTHLILPETGELIPLILIIDADTGKQIGAKHQTIGKKVFNQLDNVILRQMFLSKAGRITIGGTGKYGEDFTGGEEVALKVMRGHDLQIGEPIGVVTHIKLINHPRSGARPLPIIVKPGTDPFSKLPPSNILMPFKQKVSSYLSGLGPVMIWNFMTPKGGQFKINTRTEPGIELPDFGEELFHFSFNKEIRDLFHPKLRFHWKLQPVYSQKDRLFIDTLHHFGQKRLKRLEKKHGPLIVKHTLTIHEGALLAFGKTWVRFRQFPGAKVEFLFKDGKIQEVTLITDFFGDPILDAQEKTISFSVRDLSPKELGKSVRFQVSKKEAGPEPTHREKRKIFSYLNRSIKNPEWVPQEWIRHPSKEGREKAKLLLQNPNKYTWLSDATSVFQNYPLLDPNSSLFWSYYIKKKIKIQSRQIRSHFGYPSIMHNRDQMDEKILIGKVLKRMQHMRQQEALPPFFVEVMNENPGPHYWIEKLGKGLEDLVSRQRLTKQDYQRLQQAILNAIQELQEINISLNQEAMSLWESLYSESA